MPYHCPVGNDADITETNIMFKLIDTFNDRTISKHRTLDAAVKAQAKHSRMVREANGGNSYIPKKIVEVIDGKDCEVCEMDLMAAEQRLGA